MSARASLALIRAFGEDLTKRQLEVLALMESGGQDGEDELVYERGVGYVGHRRVSGRTVFALLRACAIRAEHNPDAKLERYTINETVVSQFAGRKCGPRPTAARPAVRLSATLAAGILGPALIAQFTRGGLAAARLGRAARIVLAIATPVPHVAAMTLNVRSHSCFSFFESVAGHPGWQAWPPRGRNSVCVS